MVADTPNDTNHRFLTKDCSSGRENPSELTKGQQKLYSFYAPSLEAGDFTINTTQKIKVPSGEEKIVKSSQTFTVVAPRFTLPVGSIHSVYPSPGRTEPVKTLPHVVLNDPHLPWERDSLATKKESDGEQNKVPWLAVLVFTQEELRLDKEYLKRDSGIFPETVAIPPPPNPKAQPPPPPPPPEIPQNKTLAINMTIKDLLAVKQTSTPIRDLPPTEDELSCTTDVIFLQKELFNNLVTAHGKDGKPVEQKCDEDGKPMKQYADVSRYKYLAHARKVSTIGMVIDNPDHEAFFSVVISHRVGPLNLKMPTPVVVHLVSIEGVGKMEFPITTDFVALSSLYSWTYTCLPARSMDMLDSFKHLGSTLEMLRPPWKIIEKVEPAGKELGEGELPTPTTRIRQRMYDGYSLVRYITQTGEETVAFTRGPLTPTTVKHPLGPGWGISTFGSDLQILDTKLGVMDITYSSAWQLGKALALADHPFAAALSRVRSRLLDEAMSCSKVDAITKKHPGVYMTGPQTLKSLLKTTMDLHRLFEENPAAGQASPSPPIATDGYSHGSDLIMQTFDMYCLNAVNKLSESTEGDRPFDEHNTPKSTDWMVVFSWILDRMYLVNVPAHYLISDPTHLPPESLRFFHIDGNWVDAMIDGALSISNHMQCYDSTIRTVIKKMVNLYLETPHQKKELLPQIPTYGFLLRSDICSQFPHLVIEVEMPGHPGAPLLYHKNLDKGVMLCLFDRVPSNSEFTTLTFTQPPHQQCFSAGDSLNESTFRMIYKQAYPVGDVDDKTYVWDSGKPAESVKGEVKVKGPPVFLWGDNGSIRTLLFPPFAQAVYDSNKSPDPYPGAAMVGIQLGSAIYKLEIRLNELMSDHAKTKPGLVMLDPPYVSPNTKPVAPPEARGPSLIPRLKCSCSPATLPPDKLNYWKPETYPELAGLPVFHYESYSVQSPSRKLLMTNFNQDLVFSIVLKRRGGNQRRLEKVVLGIPIGDINGGRPQLLDAYDGPVKMLSNLRFNVLAQNSGGTLSVTLLPRTKSKGVLIKNINEISFLMSGAKVHRYPNLWIEVDISVDEWYDGQSGMSESNTFKVKLVRSE